jgi:signal transduction histidine kinase
MLTAARVDACPAQDWGEISVMALQLDDTERLRRLQSLTDAALAHLDLDPLLSTLLERTREALEVDTCAVLLVDGGELRVRAAVGPRGVVERGGRIRVGAGLVGRVVAEARSLLLDEVDDREGIELLGSDALQAALAVPLVARGVVLGVLAVGALGKRRFDDDAVELLRLAADRAAVGIEHARSFEAEREARIRLENIQTVTDAALAHLELEELLAVLLPKVREILHADTCAVLLLDEEADELVARSAVGLEEEVEQGVRIPVGGGFAGRVAATRRPVILPDVDHAHVLNPILRQKGLKSMLGVPLLDRGEAIGVLHVGTLVHRDFRDRDVDLLQLVAERVALAIGRAQLHEETLLLDRLKANFVAIASHELRTPATAVYGAFATLVGRGDDLTPDLREELLRVGYEQSERLRRLLEELLDLSRLDASTLTVEPRPLVLRSLVATIVEQSVPREFSVELDIPDDLAVVADPLVLDRVLSNLLTNAARYGALPIRVHAGRRNGHVAVTVDDAGPGVPAELQPRLFERFAVGRSGDGTGLGLAIARAYARAHGGDVIHDPDAPGARFVLLLPQD